MSVTRRTIERLRSRLGEDDPLPAPGPAEAIEPPPARIFPGRRGSTRFADQAARHTTALVGIGCVGTRYATDVVLQFQAELAVAHEAVGAVLPHEWPAENGLIALQSRVEDHHQYLLRPDLGRRLSSDSIEKLRQQAEHGIDIQPILADGLSAVACMGSGITLLNAFSRACRDRGWRVGTPLCARFARVWLQDEIGQTVGARVAVILLGERPGLGTGDGLSAYLVHAPRVGKTDGDRNMMSNIHARGTPPEVAGTRLAVLATAMLDQGTSGVGLDLSAIRQDLGGAGGIGYRDPQPRERLVGATP